MGYTRTAENRVFLQFQFGWVSPAVGENKKNIKNCKKKLKNERKGGGVDGMVRINRFKKNRVVDGVFFFLLTVEW